ncbi:MAG: DNA repair protein RadC [Chloroflexi bacterium]|nr:DNA repair protein RadC [Chloroflexota bacterium]
MIRDLPDGERPRERLATYGPSALSTAELLAILLRVGIQGENVISLATRLISTFGGLRGLARASFTDLCNVRGLGQAKAAQLKAALEIGYRMQWEAPEERPQIKNPTDVANLLMLEMSALDHEQLRVILLDTKNRVMAVHTIYKGSLNASMIRISELFRDAIKANAASVVIVHNHPSGDPTPSTEDVRVTVQIIQAGKLLDIEVLDHIVLGYQRYVSLKERGLAFT